MNYTYFARNIPWLVLETTTTLCAAVHLRTRLAELLWRRKNNTDAITLRYDFLTHETAYMCFWYNGKLFLLGSRARGVCRDQSREALDQFFARA